MKLNLLLFLWKILTAAYIIAALGLVIPVPFGLLTIVLFLYLSIPIPVALMFFPNLAAPDDFGSAYIAVMLINFVGITFSIGAIKNIKRNWRYGYVLIFLASLSFVFLLTNVISGVCNIDGGDGGIWLTKCSPGVVILNFITCCVVLYIAYKIMLLAKKEQDVPINLEGTLIAKNY